MNVITYVNNFFTNGSDSILHHFNVGYFGELMERFHEKDVPSEEIRAFLSQTVWQFVTRGLEACEFEYYDDQVSGFPQRIREYAKEDAFLHIAATLFESVVLKEVERPAFTNLEQLTSAELLWLIQLQNYILFKREEFCQILKFIDITDLTYAELENLTNVYDDFRFKKAELGANHLKFVQLWRMARNELTEYDLEKAMKILGFSKMKVLGIYQYFVVAARFAKLTGPASERIQDFINTQWFYVEGDEIKPKAAPNTITLERVVASKRELLEEMTDNLIYIQLRHAHKYFHVLNDFSPLSKKNVYQRLILGRLALHELNHEMLMELESYRKEHNFSLNRSYLNQLMVKGVYSEDALEEIPKCAETYKMILKLANTEKALAYFYQLSDVDAYQFMKCVGGYKELMAGLNHDKRVAERILEVVAVVCPSDYPNILVMMYNDQQLSVNKEPIKETLKYLVEQAYIELTSRIKEIITSKEDFELEMLENDLRYLIARNVSHLEKVLNEYEQYHNNQRFQRIFTKAYVQSIQEFVSNLRDLIPYEQLLARVATCFSVQYVEEMNTALDSRIVKLIAIAPSLTERVVNALSEHLTIVKGEVA